MSKILMPRRSGQSRLLTTSSSLAVAAGLALASPAAAITPPDLIVPDGPVAGTGLPPGELLEVGEVQVGHNDLGQMVVNGGRWLKAFKVRTALNPGSRAILQIVGEGSRAEVLGPFVVGEAGDGVLVLGNGGLLEMGGGSGVVTLGQNATAFGRLYVGSAGSAATPGLLAATEVRGGLGGGDLVFNHTSDDFIFSPGVYGKVGIANRAGRTILTTDSTISRAIVVDGGELVVEGQLDVLNDRVVVAGSVDTNGRLTVRGGGGLTAGSFLLRNSTSVSMIWLCAAIRPNSSLPPAT